ncbi:MAG: glycoside hydrolase family 5 protein [Treponema sp.]|jgi:endoglucanase|nr:glycoside hydrolase family 5 protein [Treponema sp.]
MKKLFAIFCVLAALAACNTTNGSSDFSWESESPASVLRTPPFSRGVNFSEWFETYSAQGIPFTRYTEQDFIDVKSMGVDVIRLPVRMHSMTNGAPNFALDPLLLKFLDSAVNWAEKHELYLIIDNHSFDPVKPLEESVEGMLVSVWRQIAERYKNRSTYIVYEILNEPHGISDRSWGEIQGKAIQAIRRADSNPERWIIVGGTDYNSIGKLSTIPNYSDEYLIYTFHFYDPFLFTHQGASWSSPSMEPLAGVPFPYDSKRMPSVPSALRGTWIADSLRNYYRDADVKTLRATLDRTVAFSKTRNVPIFCGEFGVFIPNSPPADRIKWYELTADMLDKRGIARTSWDYFGGFGIFNVPGGGNFNADLNVGLLRAMGFTPPPQNTQPPQPLSGAFSLYDDYPARDNSAGYWGEEVDFSLYDTNAADGEYAIRWGNAEQYNIFWFGFRRNGDLSRLAEGGYSLEFKARANKAASFDVRFVNPESSSTIPWRMRYTVYEAVLPPDSRWHTIRIPLAEMREHGAWVNAKQEWVQPRGEFNWSNVSQLEFVAEHGDLKGVSLWFDSIRIVGP